MSKFILPKNRIPKAFNQNIVDENGKVITNIGSCVACSFTKILEVINYVKTGEYIELSKGYMYGRNNYPDKRNPGMSEEYTLNILLKRGSVPLSMCNDYDEMPDIARILENRADISLLDKEAEKYALEGWEDLSFNNATQLFSKVQEHLQRYLLPLDGVLKNYKGEKHNVVIVGYEGDYILFHNHRGSDELEKRRYDEFSKAYYLDGGIDMSKLPFTDVKETDWHHRYIEKLYEEGVMKGISEREFAPDKSLTRAEVAAIICRALYGME